MSSLDLMSTASSQVTANVTASGAGNSASITNLRMEIQPGAARLATLNMTVTPNGGSAVPVEVQFLFYDAAFEDIDIHGAQKGKGASSGMSSTVI